MSRKPVKAAPAETNNNSMTLLVITVTKSSTRFVANMKEVPDNAIIRMGSQHWGKESRI